MDDEMKGAQTMDGKITLHLAISIDGFIADNDGGFDWIHGQGDDVLDTEQDYPFSDFLRDTQVVVMGNHSYQQGFLNANAEYEGKKIYVATSAAQKDKDNIHFIAGNIVDVIVKERDAGKNIFLFGGGITIDPFIKANAIDNYIIGIIPMILGEGRPLFLGGNPAIPLHLDKYSVRDGIPVLHYSKRHQFIIRSF